PYDQVYGWGILLGVGATFVIAGTVVIRSRPLSLRTQARIGEQDTRGRAAMLTRRLSSAARHAGLPIGDQRHHRDNLLANDVIVAAQLLHQQGVSLFAGDRWCV